ncbi:hypothetical protein CcaverHIS631_0204970 [Cutaneotrichosporon cavernicola]|nr:hypothetical protein CcaverHIS631_0204970 [Cutaneotrichosporon cavernicola]
MAPTDMYRIEARIASFAAVTRPKRLAKVAFPLDPSTHPALTPASLAAAGFYHTPSSGEEDTCSCFLWFICAPSKTSPDGTTCPLCNYEVVEWEEDDDPMTIHKRKEPECPFFTATVKKGRRTKAVPKRATRAQTIDESVQEIAPPAEEATAAAAPKRRGRPPKASASNTTIPTDVSVQAIPPPEEPAAPKRRGRPPKASSASSANTSTASAKPRAKRKTAAEKRAEAAAAIQLTESAEAADASVDSLELPEVPEDSTVLVEPPPADESASSTEERETKPLPRKGRAQKPTQNDTEAGVDVPSRATRSAPAPKEALAPSTADNVEPLPAAPPAKLSKALPALPASPSVPLATQSAAFAVADMVRAAGGSGSTTIGAQDRAMTLEDFVRKQFQVQHDQLRDQGEAMITAWEVRAGEGRERLERAFA